MGRKLVGWKEIAEVLRVHPRTAQEWEKQEGDMPVARPMGQRVFADEQELAAWWEQKRERGKLKPLEKDGKVTHRVFYTIVVVLLGLGAFFLWNYATLPGKPVTVRIDDGVIKILDEQGTLCFVIDSSGLHVGAYEKALANLSLPPEKPLKDRRLIFTDLEQNSSLETLFSEVSERSQEERSHLVCYEEDGGSSSWGDSGKVWRSRVPAKKLHWWPRNSPRKESAATPCRLRLCRNSGSVSV